MAGRAGRAPAAGYSGTPLAKKLGVRDGARVALLNAPPGFRDTLTPLPAGVTFAGGAERPLDLVVLFVRYEAELRSAFAPAAARLAPNGMLWVAWPKKSAKAPTDLVEDAVQRIGLEHGLVDTKVCAIDEIWSGLRFVRRLKDR
jgi:hypothetical protein